MITPIEVFSELKLFVCTYVAKIGNININFEQLTHILCGNLSGNILALNSNYGHSAQPGYEYYMKHQNTSASSSNAKGRTRKIQGDGTCFNSAIEPVIKLDESREDKVYFIKCFPTTGETQIPGVINDDYSDGHNVLVTFIDYLNGLQLGIQQDGIIQQIYIEHEGPKMLNYKFKLNRESDRILINLIKLAEYLTTVERHMHSNSFDPSDCADTCTDGVDNSAIVDSSNGRVNSNVNGTVIYGDLCLIKFPFPIKEIKSPVDDIKVSFRFQTSVKRAPRINIFQEGKINILGAESESSAIAIYEFLRDTFKHNWHKLINIKPEKDALR